ncbi:hypothetical protein OG889_21455 [Streptomyces sp. NBC_00481]|uniref:hypothetical protein n=1 Tax=unclassified Streptomyces TaxID=2593676 RepID=UPI002DD96136|nr:MULTISPECIES: hypothetical protein [unclassified Streptomyces]WRY97074.1 hypothetical protein OG889_21455 [Streptomyces sp. NBC_00481]
MTMTRMHKYVAVAALTTVLAGVPSMSYAVSRGETAHGTDTAVAAAVAAAARKAPTPRIVAPGEHVVAAPGFELWLTAEGKHWTDPDMPDDPQFRSVVDGNIDPTRPGVSLQGSGFEGRYFLSGLYYGGKGTASRVEVATSTGKVRGKLIELAGKPGWGVWYAIADLPSGDDGEDFLREVTVYDTRGRVYSQLPLS